MVEPTTRRTRIPLLVIAALGVGIAVVWGGVVIGRHLTAASNDRLVSGAPVAQSPAQPTTRGSPPPAQAPEPSVSSGGLADEFADVMARLNADAGVVVSAVGGNGSPIALGGWHTGPAWSTIKVPLVIAALREAQPPVVTDAMTAAITKSDNDAAEAIWEGLGDPATAAQKVQAVLGEAADPTVVESRRIRAQYSASGQTDWPLIDQARFIGFAACQSSDAPILDLMARIEADQSWGLGVIPGAKFKGGWGPGTDGRYLVRQIGLIPTPAGLAAVAIAVQPGSGTFSDGTAALTGVVNWLTTHLDVLPGGRCAP